MDTGSSAVSLSGKVLGNCYLESLIGEGTTSEVYLARHQTLGIQVAVKVLKLEPMGMKSHFSTYRERFRREAQIAARLTHPGIIRIHDFGETQGLFYQVLEYVKGSNLQQFLKKRGVLSEKLAIQVILFLGNALESAHKMGIVHRDLKPSNVLLTQDGQLKISDLGLAKDDMEVELTSANNTVGTPVYMAPEMFTSGKKASPQSDIYALGVILYQMIFGRTPFVGSYDQIVTAHWKEKPIFKADGIEIHPETERILGILLAKSPQERPESCEEMVRLLKKQLPNLRRNTETVVTPSQGPDAETGSFSNLAGFLERRLGSKSSEYQGVKVTHTTNRERVVVWILLAALLLIGVIAYFQF